MGSGTCAGPGSRRCPRCRPRRRTDRGAAALEFALLVPLLVFLVVVIVNWGVSLGFRQSVSAAASQGARAYVTTVLPAQRSAAAYAGVSAALGQHGLDCTAGVLKRKTTTVGRCDLSVASCDSGSAQCVWVTVSYDLARHPLIAVPGVGVALPATLSYTASARLP